MIRPPAGGLPAAVCALGAVKLVETDQVQREVLDAVEQTVEPGVIADCGDDAGAADDLRRCTAVI